MSFTTRPQRENNQMVFGIRAVIEAIRSGKKLSRYTCKEALAGA